jgi:hypothetical protein
MLFGELSTATFMSDDDIRFIEQRRSSGDSWLQADPGLRDCERVIAEAHAGHRKPGAGAVAHAAGRGRSEAEGLAGERGKRRIFLAASARSPRLVFLQ